MKHSMEYYGQTACGLVRKNNEDQFLIAELSCHQKVLVRQTSLPIEPDTSESKPECVGQVLLVADGLGGHDGGEFASSMAVEAMLEYLPEFMIYPDQGHCPQIDDTHHRMHDLISKCQHRIQTHGQMLGQNSMGTTLTMACILWPRLMLLHVGDSRAYLFQNGVLNRLTADQTFAQKLLDNGVISETEAQDSPLSHTLWSYLGVESDKLFPQIQMGLLKADDVLLICSDGLTNQVDEETIKQELIRMHSPQESCDSLVKKALESGGRDNITVVIARREIHSPCKSLYATEEVGIESGIYATGKQETVLSTTEDHEIEFGI